MEIIERSVGTVTVFDLHGRLALGDGDALLREKVNSAIGDGRTRLLLNMEDVPFVDSSGLGEVVRSYTTLTRKGGKLKLLKPGKRIRDLLAITKLLSIFEVFDDEQAAVDSFS